MSIESMRESTSVEAFEAHRPLLVSIAYRMLGSLAEAEDVVQEAWPRWDRIDRAGIANDRRLNTRTWRPAFRGRGTARRPSVPVPGCS